MNDNVFILDLLALLDRQKSKTQINTDIKNLEQLVRKLKLTATLARGNTKTEINQTIKQIEAQLRQVKIQAKMDHRQLNREINAALRNVSARDIQLNINSNSERLNAQIRRTVSQAREYVSRNPIGINIDLKKEKLLNQLAAFTNKHTKINESSYWLREAERLRGVIGSVTDRNGLRNATDQFQVFTSGVRATGYAAVSTTDKIKGMIGNVAKVGNYFGLAFVAVNKFRQSLNTLKENDTIITEISKTSEMTAQQLRELGDEAFAVASKYGQVSGNYLTAVQEMARSGYEMTSKELGELSLLAQSAGDMTAEMANNYILATDAAYKYGGSIDRLNAALDGANYISNKNSASLSDIADATRVSASFIANTGVAIDELTAAEATMVAATKRSGSEMGRAFRSIILNLQQVSGEFDGEVIDEESLKKVEDRCHSLGVELEYVKDGVATLRNPMEVLKDLAEVYNSLPDNSADKQGLISDIGGKYHANALSALLSHWNMYEKMLGEFSQGAGSALEEANKTADSWAGRVAQLQNTWDEFVSSLTSKEAVKGGVSFLDNTIQAFTKLSDTLGAIPVIMTAINGIMTAFNKNYGIMQVFNGGKLDVRGNFMGIDITGFKAQKKHFSEAETAFSGWNRKLIAGTADIETFGGAVVQNNKHLKEYLATTSKDAPASLQGYKSYLNAAGVSTDALRLKTVLMTSALTMGLSLGIQAVATTISEALDSYIHRVEKARERTAELFDGFRQMNDTLSEHRKTVSELADRYEGLSKGVSLSTNKNESLSTEEYEEFLDINEQLAQSFPILTKGIDENGNSILTLGTNGITAKEELEELLRTEEDLNNFRIAQEIGDAFAGVATYVAEANDAEEYLNSSLDRTNEEISSLQDFIENGVGLRKDAYKLFSGDMTDKAITDYAYAMQSAAQDFMNGLGNDRRVELEAMGVNPSDLFTMDRDELTGRFDFYANLYSLTPEEINNLEALITDNVETLNGALADQFSSQEQEAKDIISQAQNTWRDFIPNLVSGMKSKQTFRDLDPDLQDLAVQVVEGLDYSYANAMESYNPSDPYAYIRDKFIVPMGELDDSDKALLKSNFEGLFRLNPEDISKNNRTEIDNLINAIAAILEKDPLELQVALGFDAEDIQDRYNAALNEAKRKLGGYGNDDRGFESNNSVGDKLDSFWNENVKTEEDWVLWQNVTDGITDATEAMNAYTKAKNDAVNANNNPAHIFSEAFNSLDTDIQQKLLDLAKSGEITAETLSSTEEYNALLTQTGLSADSAKNQILDMLSAQEKLSGASQGLGKLKSSYEEFRDLGFVTAQSLESLPDAFKELDGYDLFSEVVGDPTQGTEKIQEAFNGIVREYIISQDTLSGLINASESDIQSYIANLTEMGITNAEEVVNAAIQAMGQESELLNAAEEEYLDYLNAKEGYDDEYLNSVISKNSQLAAALGEPYKADYDNWCSLLSKKAQAYNRFVSLLSKSQQAANFSGSPLSDYGKAKEIMRESAGKNPKAIEPQVSGFANRKNLSAYTKDQIDAAKEYVGQYEQAQKLKDELKFDLSSIDTDFSTGYSPKGSGGSGSGGSGSKKEETKKQFSELFDWVERRIKKFQRSFDKWVSRAETAVTSGFVNRYYKKASSAAKKELSAYGKAHSRYMAQADSVGLDEKYAKKVRNGTIDIEAIRAEGTEEEIKQYEELADKIKEYQDWYDKAQDSMDSFTEAAEKLANIPLDKAARKAELFSNAVDLLGKRMDNAISAKTKNKLVDRQTKEEKKTLNAHKSAQKETGKQLKAARRELRKSRNLDADDGITAKEKKKIQKAMRKGNEADLSFFREGSAGYKAAVRYNEALKANRKATDEAKAAQQDYSRWLVEAAKMKFDNITDKYEKKLQLIGYEMSALDNKVAEIEAAGKKVDKAYYESQKKVNASTLAKYKAEKAALEESIKGIKKGTDEWYDAKDAIQQVEDAISGCVEEAYDLNNAINQLHFDLFGDVSDSIKRIVTEQEFLQGLFAHEKNADNETGNLTEAGIAKLGSLSASYHASKSNAERDASEVAELQRMFDSGSLHSDLLGITFNSLDDLKAKLDETYTKWQDDIGETYRLEASISDLMKEKYQAELDMLKELIDAKTEALNAEKDLHDYQKTLNEKAESISTIQKQIAAYSGDTSQEGMARLQKLQKELADREEDLRETEYDRYISDQEEMLGKLYNEYEELMGKKLDDFMSLVSEGLQTAEENTSIISSYLGKVASDNGYTEETEGLFSGISASISGNVDRVIAAMSSDVSSRSGTDAGNAQPGGSASQTPGKGGTAVSKGNTSSQKQDKTDWKGSVRDFIRGNAVKADKKKSEYGDVNKAVYDNKGKLYQGKGKVLPSKALKELAKLIGIKYTGDNSKDGAFYKKLKTLKIPGFKKGGVVSVDDIEEQVRENGDTSLVSVQSGEGILTKEETKAVRKLADNAEEPNKTIMINGAECTLVSQEDLLKSFIDMSHPGMDTANVDILSAIKNFMPDFSNMPKNNMPDIPPVTNNSHSNVVNIDNITLPNVKNYSEFKNQMLHDIQAEKKAGNVFHGVAGVSQMSDGRKLNRTERGF